MTRTAKSFARVYGSLDRVAWIRDRQCVSCWASPCHGAHTASGGTGRKADYTTIVSLCPACHAESHRGVKTFEARWGVDLKEEAEDTQRAWVKYNGGTDPLDSVARKA